MCKSLYTVPCLHRSVKNVVTQLKYLVIINGKTSKNNIELEFVCLHYIDIIYHLIIYML